MDTHGDGNRNGYGDGAKRTAIEEPVSEPGLTTAPLPSSRKIFVEGARPGVRVAMREIALSPTRHARDGTVEVNEPVVVYDTSGPYTDPDAAIDIRKGLAPLRRRGSWGAATWRRCRACRPSTVAGARTILGWTRSDSPICESPCAPSGG